MHILLTGAAGLVGSHTFLYLLDRGHQVTGVDVVSLKAGILLPLPPKATFTVLDLTDYKAFEAFMRSLATPCDGIVHLGAIPNPGALDDRTVHNNNVTSTYNVLKTAVDLGIRRIVQASSVNAIGLTFTLPEHRYFNAVPMDEKTPMRPEDAYALSKQYAFGVAPALLGWMLFDKSSFSQDR